jgi:hypothetical protein
MGAKKKFRETNYQKYYRKILFFKIQGAAAAPGLLWIRHCGWRYLIEAQDTDCYLIEAQDTD